MKKVTKRQAEQALRTVQKKWQGYVDAGSTPPALQQREGHWTIVWEEGPFDWTTLASLGGVNEELAYELRESGLKAPMEEPLEMPEGVYSEPWNGWQLGLYLEHWAS